MALFDRILRSGEGRKLKALQGLVPDINAFRVHAQKMYLASDDAKNWPAGMIDKINAL